MTILPRLALLTLNHDAPSRSHCVLSHNNYIVPCQDHLLSFFLLVQGCGIILCYIVLYLWLTKHLRISFLQKFTSIIGMHSSHPHHVIVMMDDTACCFYCTCVYICMVAIFVYLCIAYSGKTRSVCIHPTLFYPFSRKVQWSTILYSTIIVVCILHCFIISSDQAELSRILTCCLPCVLLAWGYR